MPAKGSFLNGGGLWTGGGGFYPRGGLVVGWTWRREPGRGTVSTGVSLVQTPHLNRFAVSVFELENSVVFLQSICNQVMGLLLHPTICFVKFSIRIRVLGIKYSGLDGIFDPCLE